MEVAEEEPVAPRSVDRKIPRDLETVVLKALAKKPEERYQSAQELADDTGLSIKRLDKLFKGARGVVSESQTLTEKGDGLICTKCKLLYEIKDDIPIMLVDDDPPSSPR
jgi:uncharacterized protein YbaR (Trm112 family)